MADYIKLEEEKNKPRKKRKINFIGIFFLFIIIFIIISTISSITYSYSSKIAVVPIKGIITTEKSSSLFAETISSREIANILKEIESDSSIKSVILDINSPGGSAVASEEISKAIESLKTKKKVYALINDMGASGAFWVAVSADEVITSPMSIVGSIGVTSAGLGFENFIENWNITYRKQTAGKYKDMGSPYRKPTEEEEKITQNLLNDIHYKFIEHIAKSRNITIENVTKFATGEIFLGEKALEMKFVDELGYYPDVIEKIENETGNKNLLIVNYGPEPTLFDSLGMSSMLKDNSFNTRIMLK